MALNLITPPAVEPVSLAELKEHLRVDAGDMSQDNTLTALGMAARGWVEAHCERRMVQQTWRLLMDFFPGYIDMKLAGARVSSPFVSGSNAILAGIRYAIILPFPPVFSLVDFTYQNANGQVTSMITGPATIASVQNINGQPLLVTTAAPLGLQTGAGIVIGGNAELLAFLGGQIFQTITLLSPTTFLLNGTVGDGVTSISGGGTATGFNFVYDLQANPARLMPVFGQMWPVARVTANAVQIDYQVGYAIPVPVTSVVASPPNPYGITSNYSFLATDVGRVISIPGAGVGAGNLSTVIASVSGMTATLRDPIQTPVTAVTALLVNNLNCNQQHWEMMKAAIKHVVEGMWRRVDPDTYEKQAKRICSVARDQRL